MPRRTYALWLTRARYDHRGPKEESPLAVRRSKESHVRRKHNGARLQSLRDKALNDG